MLRTDSSASTTKMVSLPRGVGWTRTVGSAATGPYAVCKCSLKSAPLPDPRYAARLRLHAHKAVLQDQFQHNVLADEPAEHLFSINDQRIKVDNLWLHRLLPAKGQQLAG